MKFRPFTCLSLIPLFGPGTSAAPVNPLHPAGGGAIVSAEEAVLQEHSVADLIALRAGGVERPAGIDVAERDVLCAAQARSADLADLRGGGIGEGTLLVLIVVLLILVLV